MLLKNMTAKVIGVGPTILMPDGMNGDSAEFPKEVGDTPAVKVLVEKGFLKATADKRPPKAKKAVEETVSAEEGNDTAEEKKPVKRAPRKPKEAVEEADTE